MGIRGKLTRPACSRGSVSVHQYKKVPDLRLAWVCSEKGDVSSTELLLEYLGTWRLDPLEISLKFPEAS